MVCAAVERFNETASPDDRIQHQLLNTGQHYDFAMAEVFFQQLPLPTPDFDLGVGSGSHGAQTAAMLQVDHAHHASPRHQRHRQQARQHHHRQHRHQHAEGRRLRNGRLHAPTRQPERHCRRLRDARLDRGRRPDDAGLQRVPAAVQPAELHPPVQGTQR
ncbi:hypothetical protein B4Q13_25045, partial [Lacticaseibacillus rhamnosus]